METSTNEVAGICNDSFDLVNRSFFNDQIKTEYNSLSLIISLNISDTQLFDDSYDISAHAIELGS